MVLPPRSGHIWESQVLLTGGQMIFPGFSGFRQTLMNDRLDIREIFLKKASVAHNFDTFYATKLKFGMILTLTKTLDFMVELPLGHIEHMQNGNRIIRLVPLLAIES